MSFETFSIACLEEPDLVEAVLHKISGWSAKVTEEMCKLDFDFLWCADDIAYNTAPMFSPKVYREILLPHTRKVAEKIIKPWVYHSDGNIMPLLDDLLTLGMNAIHPLEAGAMDLEELKAKYGDKVAFVGGIDLVILEGGSVEETKVFTREMLKRMEGCSYIIGSSNSLTANVKPENLRAMLDELEEYYRYASQLAANPV